jgi:hypothetical protein
MPATTSRAHPRLALFAAGWTGWLPPCAPDDTLHYRSCVQGSAVQFNSSVSAMPQLPLPHSFAPVALGTADTLLLRWAARRLAEVSTWQICAVANKQTVEG